MEVTRLGTGFARPMFRMDRGQIRPLLGIECAAAIAIPLGLGVATGHTNAGGWGAIGAFLTNFSLYQPGFRLRVRITLTAAAVVSSGIFLGAVVGIDHPTIFLLVAAWSFLAGMLVAAGPNAAIVGTISSVGLVVATSLNATARVAFEDALCAFGGGLCVVVLAIAFHWRARRGEAIALAAAYRSLGTYAAKIPSVSVTLPDAGPFDAVAATLATSGPHRFRVLGARDRTMCAQSEALRSSLGALSLARHHASRGAVGAPSDLLRVIDAIAVSVADVLIDISQACADDRPCAPIGPFASQALALDHLARGLGTRGETLATLFADIRSALRSARRALDGRGAQWRGHDQATETMADALAAGRGWREAVLAIHSNLTLESTACRHALRLSAVVTVATLFYRLIDTHDGYWIVVAVLFIMKPDYASTINRGVLRILGTLAGASLTTLLLVTTRPGPAALSVLIVIMSVFAYALFTANYGAFTVFLTCLTVCLAASLGLPPVTAVLNRTVDNMIGAGLTILAMTTWPSWAATEVPALIATCLRAEERFVDAVLCAIFRPRGASSNTDDFRTADLAVIDRRIRQARLARSNAEAAVERMAAETSGRRKEVLPLAVAETILAQMHRFGLAGLSLRASRTSSGVTPFWFTPTRVWLGTSVENLAAAIDSGSSSAASADGYPIVVRNEDGADCEAVGVMCDAVTVATAAFNTSR
jgi:uncharacterized membrane protein YccC